MVSASHLSSWGESHLPIPLTPLLFFLFFITNVCSVFPLAIMLYEDCGNYTTDTIGWQLYNRYNRADKLKAV